MPEEGSCFASLFHKMVIDIFYDLDIIIKVT